MRDECESLVNAGQGHERLIETIAGYCAKRGTQAKTKFETEYRTLYRKQSVKWSVRHE